jgi:hypothetical protein
MHTRTHTHTHIHTYIHTHIHTYTHTHIHKGGDGPAYPVFLPSKPSNVKEMGGKGGAWSWSDDGDDAARANDRCEEIRRTRERPHAHSIHTPTHTHRLLSVRRFCLCIAEIKFLRDAHTYTPTQRHTQTHTHAHIHTQRHTDTHAHIHTYTHTHAWQLQSPVTGVEPADRLHGLQSFWGCW